MAYYTFLYNAGKRIFVCVNNNDISLHHLAASVSLIPKLLFLQASEQHELSDELWYTPIGVPVCSQFHFCYSM
jgi:hypothetical protein